MEDSSPRIITVANSFHLCLSISWLLIIEAFFVFMSPKGALRIWGGVSSLILVTIVLSLILVKILSKRQDYQQFRFYFLFLFLSCLLIMCVGLVLLCANFTLTKVFFSFVVIYVYRLAFASLLYYVYLHYIYQEH